MVSVIMPVYNAAGTLDRAIDSMLSQDYGDLELILIDDGSTDQGSQKMKGWELKDPRIQLFSQEHSGIVAALLKGLHHARGKYIARMDSDDFSPQSRISRQVRFLEQNPGIDLVSGLISFDGDFDEQAGYARYVHWINSLKTHEEIALNRFIESPLAHPSVLFRSAALEQFGSYRDGDFPEDYELWLRWLEQGVKMAKIDQPVLYWNDRRERLSRNHPRYSFDAFYRTKAPYLARWLERHNPHHPNIVVWGSGRTTRKRVEYLQDEGIIVQAYVDIDPNKIGKEIHGIPVWAPEEVPAAGRCFVVSYVARYEANVMIEEALSEKGYRLGEHFIFAA